MNTGDCIGHAHGDCRFSHDCKYEHLSSAKLQRIESEVASRKGTSVSLVADGKKESPKDKVQSQVGAAPVMATASNTLQPSADS